MQRQLEKTPPAPLEPAPLLEPGHTMDSVTARVSDIVLTRRISLGWLLGLAIAFALVMGLLLAASQLFTRGVGIWGNDIPSAWAYDITNFVWWIGIGHAGTLISAILLLLQQRWRTSINRFAEAMTVFAVAQAALFPILHLGRPWLFFWLLPYPNTMNVYPQFRSPLVWDAFAVLTYMTVSIVFWYVGMIPDLASLRDRATRTWQRVFYGVFALGWRGSAAHWQRYQKAYFLVAALVTPLVVSVHTIVSFDFAVSVIPGWHSTIFPPYFVAGAIYSGFAMVLVLMLPLRAAYGLKGFITMRHIENGAKVMLASGLVVAYGYLMENFTGLYSGVLTEQQLILKRFVGEYAPIYWAQLACNVIIPQLLWIKRVRTNIPALWVISLIILVGMWLERFVIIVTSLSRSFLPSLWGTFNPTIWDFLTLFGTIGLFFTMLFLFLRLLPSIAIFEMRELVADSETPEAKP